MTTLITAAKETNPVETKQQTMLVYRGGKLWEWQLLISQNSLSSTVGHRSTIKTYFIELFIVQL